MAKCMPKAALPRVHPKHPSGLHKFYDARRLVSQELEGVKTRIQNLYASDKCVEVVIGRTIKWQKCLKCPGPGMNVANHLQDAVASVAIAFEDAIITSITLFVVLRNLQQEVNRMRGYMSDMEAKEICCCKLNHFLKETSAFSYIISRSLMGALHCSSVAVNGSASNTRYCPIPNRVAFWDELRSMEQSKLLQEDKTLAILRDVINAHSLPDQADAMAAFVVHLDEQPAERHRFDPAKLRQTLGLIKLFGQIYGCVLVVSSDGIPCTHYRDCFVKYCGLHGFLRDISTVGPYLLAVREPNFYRLTLAAAWRFIEQSEKIVRYRQIWDAAVRYMRASCELNGICGDTTFKTSGSFCQGDALGPDGQSHGHRRNVFDELLQFLETTSSQTGELDSSATTTKDRTVREAKYEDDNESSMSVTTEAAIPELQMVQPVQSADDGPLENVSQTEPEASKPQEIPDTPPRVFRQVNKKIAANRGNNIRHARAEPSNSTTVSRYGRRGFGKAYDTPVRPRSTTSPDIHERVWIVDNPAFYHDVWRVIFPQTKAERQITRVSWSLFKQAIESPPVNCHNKKAADPVFVWERENGKGGKEIFQCHAPHDKAWIPASDLYRYRKDLRDSFGMDADRILPKGEVYKKVEHKCGSTCRI